jgi:hypothetical protein
MRGETLVSPRGASGVGEDVRLQTSWRLNTRCRVIYFITDEIVGVI